MNLTSFNWIGNTIVESLERMARKLSHLAIYILSILPSTKIVIFYFLWNIYTKVMFGP